MSSKQQPTKLKHFINLQSEAVFNSIDFNPNGRLLATGRDDNTITIYRISDWEIEKQLVLKESIDILKWNNNGSKLAVGGFDLEVSIWDSSDWLKIISLQEIVGASSFSWNKKYNLLAVGLFNYCESPPILINCKDWTNNSLDLDYSSSHISFDPSDSLLAVCNGYNGLDILNIPSFTKKKFLDFSDYISEEPADITQPSWSSDGQFLAASNGDGRVRIWSTKDWKVVTTLTLFDYWDEAKYTCQFSPDNRFLICGGLGLPRVIDTKTWSVIQSFGDNRTEDNLSISWHPSSSLLAFTSRPPSTVEIWKILDNI